MRPGPRFLCTSIAVARILDVIGSRSSLWLCGSVLGVVVFTPSSVLQFRPKGRLGPAIYKTEPLLCVSAALRWVLLHSLRPLSCHLIQQNARGDARIQRLHFGGVRNDNGFV